jgi:hypothetical protein
MSKTDKESHYKLDFKPEINGKKYSMSDFAPRNRWSAHHNNSIVTNEILDSYRKSESIDQLFSLVDQDCIELVKKSYHYRWVNENEFLSSLEEIKKKGYKEWSNASYVGTNLYSVLENLLSITIWKTKEFEKPNEDFQKWLLKRPGVVAAWKDVYPADELNLRNLSKKYRQSDFRTKLENARPRKIAPGLLVELKEEYLNKWGKDPFYWKKDFADQKRVGMLTKPIPERTAFGVGSRIVNVCWIASGEESEIMERCLKVVE